MTGASLAVAFLTLLVTINATILTGEQWFNNKHGINQENKSKNVREAIYTQWVDHFNLGAGTFDQRIFINDQFYSPGGPVFIYVSEHGESEDYWVENSYVAEIAAQEGGVVYGIEPRFHGNSRPTQDLSMQNLQLLTINQTLADIVDFTTFLRTNLIDFGSDKFIIFGYETGGKLAVFAHQRNPGLFNGVWASGAPTITFMNFDFYFFDIQLSATNLLDERCTLIIGAAFDELETLSLAGDAARITQLFGLLQPIVLSDVRQLNLLYYMTTLYISYHFEWGSAGDRTDFCQSITQFEDNGATALEALTTYLYPVTAGSNVNWAEAIDAFRQTSWNSDAALSGARQLWYATCTQWSWFRLSNLLPVPVRDRFQESFFTAVCFDIFGFTRNEVLFANSRTDQDMHVRDDLRYVFFTFGGTDPFRLLGVRDDLNEWSPGHIIPGYGKAFDLMGTMPGVIVSPELARVRAHARDQILAWIRN